MICIRWAGVEVEVLVEAPRLIVLRVNEDGSDAGDVGGLQSSGQGVVQERRAQAPALGGVIDGEAGKQHDWNGVAGQAFCYPGRRLGMSDSANGEAVVADYPTIGDGDIGLRAACRLVVEGEAAKVAIEVFVPTVERIDEVGAIQLADCPARRAGGSQGLPARRHQAGKARAFARRCVERGLEGIPLCVVENEQAAVGEGFGGRGQPAVEQEFADRLVLGAGGGLDHFLGGRGNP